MSKRTLISFALTVFSLLAGCANDPVDTYAYCQRWAAKYMAYGNHANLNAYREDLISTCMAMKKAPYTPQPAPVASPAR